MMKWNLGGKFQIINGPGRHYVHQLSNRGKVEINIPSDIKNKRQAAMWLRNNPNKVSKARFKPKKLGMHIPINWKPLKTPSPFLLKPIMTGKNVGYYQAVPGGQMFAFGSPKYPSPPKIGTNRFTCSAGKHMKPIGKGRQGIVFKGPDNDFVAKVCPRDLVAAKRGERQPPIIEFEIQKTAHSAAPSGVVDVYKHEKCIDFIPPTAMNMANVQNSNRYDKSKQSIIFMEYCSGGSLTKWLDSRKQSDATLRHVISSVLKTINTIQNKFPDFRHNDLHMDNIFVADRGFLIGDFGWARLQRTGTNPAVNTANTSGIANVWGIGPRTDPRYDHHCFLNNLRHWVSHKGGLPQTIAFLDMAVPLGYRGVSSVHVNDWRLKYRDPCPGLPTLKNILKNKFITGQRFNSPNLLAARARLRPVKRRVPFKSANLVRAKAKLRPVKRRLPFKSANLLAAKARLRKAVKPKAPKKSPSKRVKILNPETGRMVYADGPTITLAYLKNLAARKGVNIKGLRAKNNIARKILSITI
jgi:hypothetical protein